MRHLLIATVAAMTALTATAPAAEAQRRAPATQPLTVEPGAHPSSRYYRRAPQVRGFVQRRGGYSYSYNDVINTYGNARAVYGSTNTYRNPFLDLQSRSGPFDHGFFFDSGVSPRGGNAPY